MTDLSDLTKIWYNFKEWSPLKFTGKDYLRLLLLQECAYFIKLVTSTRNRENIDCYYIYEWNHMWCSVCIDGRTDAFLVQEFPQVIVPADSVIKGFGIKFLKNIKLAPIQGGYATLPPVRISYSNPVARTNKMKTCVYKHLVNFYVE